MNLEMLHEKEMPSDVAKELNAVLNLSKRIKESDFAIVSSSRVNVMQFTNLMLDNLKRLIYARPKEKNDKTINLMMEEIKNISTFCGISEKTSSNINALSRVLTSHPKQKNNNTYKKHNKYNKYNKDKNLKTMAITDVQATVFTQIEQLLEIFEINKFVEVRVYTNNKYEDGWYVFRNDADIMEGFYSTCISGKVNLINKDGQTKCVGLGQISIK